MEERIATWLKRLGLISSFSVSALSDGNIFQVKVRKSPTSSEVLLSDVGFGVSQVLPVLVSCLYVPEGSTLILEQPEVHLHPTAQAELADFLIECAQEGRIQLLVESHSDDLLNRILTRTAEKRFDNDKAALYYCENSAAGSKISRLVLDSLGNISNMPPLIFGDQFGELLAAQEARVERLRNGSEA
jgi:predicted ATPase